MAVALLREGLVQGKQTNVHIVQTTVGTVLDERFGGGDCMLPVANIEAGGVASAAAAAVAAVKLPGGEQEVMEWAPCLGGAWRSALRIGDVLLLLQVVNVVVVIVAVDNCAFRVQIWAYMMIKYMAIKNS